MSSQKAKDYHSLIIYDKKRYDPRGINQESQSGRVNTWDDWHLIPSSRPVFDYPEMKTKIVDIPGSNGVLDLSTSLTAYPLYNNREGTLEFIVANNQWSRWMDANSEIANWLSGKTVRIILEDDPSYFYEGTLRAKEWKTPSNQQYSNVTFEYSVYPYKMYLYTTSEGWLWDPFCFETDITYDYMVNIQIDTTYGTNIQIINDQMPVIPVFKASTEDRPITIRIVRPDGSTTELTNVIPTYWYGNYSDPRLYLAPGENNIHISGSGTITIDFRMGRL